MRRKYICAIAAVMIVLPSVICSAQNIDSLYKAYRNDAMKEFSSFRSSAYKEFNDFRKQANEEFTDFMKKAWTELKSEEPLPVPDRPEPPKPPVFDPDSSTDPDEWDEDIVVDIVPIDVDIDLRPVNPLPIVPKRPSDDDSRIAFSFYGLSCSVRVDSRNKEYLHSTSEKNAAALWKHFSSGAFNNSVNDCLSLRQSHRLCDWAYYQLSGAFARAYYGGNYTDESVILQAYILIQSGFGVRIARVNEHFTLLASCDAEIYAATYLLLNGQKYYCLDEPRIQGAFYVCDFAYPRERPLSFFSDVRPDFPKEDISCKTFTPKGYAGVSADICNDSNMLDYLDSYPYCHWTVYAASSLGRSVKDNLYPVLRQAIAGKGEAEAANILINFVQTAFEYKTDDEQFGYERPLFADETFFYPFSDCEDRAILYSVLVRELLGLEVMLVHYPGHLATAVHFNEEVKGDFIVVNGKYYLVCDPTYINADIGMTMPGQNNSEAEVYLLRK